MKILVRIKKCLTLLIILLGQYCDDSNKPVVGKNKDVIAVIAFEEFARLKSRCILFWQMIVVSLKKQRV